MKPTVIPSASASASATANSRDGSAATSNGIQIPVHQEYARPAGTQAPYMQHQQPQFADAASSPAGAYPRSTQQQQPHHQGFGVEPNIDMDMFPRHRFGGLMHDPFGDFSGSRKRNSFHDPKDDFSHYFDDAPDFGFPEFGSMGRRRAAADHMNDNDFFNRLPSEFRSYIPEGFGHRRANAANSHHAPPPPQTAGGQYYQHGYAPTGASPPNANVAQSPSKKLCDAAIQTEDPTSAAHADVVDGVAASLPQQTDLNQHGLRNTVDMGVKSALENDFLGNRSHSAPPPEQQQQQRPLPAGRANFSTAQTQSETPQQTAHYPKSYYAPHQEPHPQQNVQSNLPPQAQPQTPGSATIRTIPIFVEGRAEPIINSHKDIPGQSNTEQPPVYTTTKNFTPQQQQQQQQPPQRPTPFNTQQQQVPHQQQEQTEVPPQTPHTLDSISKIQDIQRDVLDLMGKVEKFTGTRKDKEYVYLDEMLTRNLLKLDTIDTNGKDSIRLARKEAIKCIQASINVLEAKAEENAKAAVGQQSQENALVMEQEESNNEIIKSSGSDHKLEKSTSNSSTKKNHTAPEVEKSQSQEPIPLPPPDDLQSEQTNAAESTATNEQINSESAGHNAEVNSTEASK